MIGLRPMNNLICGDHSPNTTVTPLTIWKLLRCQNQHRERIYLTHVECGFYRYDFKSPSCMKKGSLIAGRRNYFNLVKRRVGMKLQPPTFEVILLVFEDWKVGKSKVISMIKLFDSHCHLQDSRILNLSSKLIKEALDTGVVHFAVNGVSEKDWHLVKEMNDSYPCVIPSFGLHPWFIRDRTPSWLATLKEYLATTPSAAVGEIGIDKGSVGKQIDFTDQAEIFRQQLQLAKELKRPASVHCVRAFGDLLDILKSTGPFPAGLVLHSYLGSAEMVPELSELGAYFSFSGFLMSMKESKARKMVKSIPRERILLETDAPDARPTLRNQDSLFLVERYVSEKKQLTDETGDDGSDEKGNTSAQPERNLNHPANIHHVLAYVAHLLEVEEKELAEISYKNTVRLFSYEGSKLMYDGSSSKNETEK